MQLFGGHFSDQYDGTVKFEGDDPRHHFDNIFWAFVTVFQVLTGENWNEVLYNGIKGTSWTASVIYFTLLNIVGAYIILNLFMAILLGQFDSDDEDEAGADEQEGTAGSDPAQPEASEGNGESGEGVQPKPPAPSSAKSTRPNALFEKTLGGMSSKSSKEPPFQMKGTSLFCL